MKRPNVLVYIDLASEDVAATGEFYEAVMGWTNDPQPQGEYHRMLPGGFALGSDGEETGVKNLHMGIFDVKNARPYPDPKGAEPRALAVEGRRARIWIEVSPDDTHERILAEAEKRGAKILWRDHIWSRFGGLSACFRDPWANEIVIWTEEADKPDLPAHYTRE